MQQASCIFVDAPKPYCLEYLFPKDMRRCSHSSLSGGFTRISAEQRNISICLKYFAGAFGTLQAAFKVLPRGWPLACWTCSCVLLVYKQNHLRNCVCRPWPSSLVPGSWSFHRCNTTNAHWPVQLSRVVLRCKA